MAFEGMVPPSDDAAERAVVGAVLRDPHVLSAVRAVVRPESFYFYPNRAVFAACCDLDDAQKPIDLVLVLAELKRAGSVDDCGGAKYLAELWESSATGAGAEYAAGLVRDAAVLRELIHAANEILRDAYSPVDSAREVVAAAERRLFSLSGAFSGGDRVRHAAEIVRDVCAEIDARVSSGSTLAGMSTGYCELDELLGGMLPGELIVLGARPSLGKTALALNVASNVAVGGQAVLFFSLEMPCSQIGTRLVSMHTGVAMHTLSRPRMMTARDVEMVARQSSPAGLSGCPIYVEDTPDQPAARVAAVCRREVRRSGVALAVIDYLQLMRPENPRENRTQQVGALALRVKNMARDAGIPVILLSQLNRELEHAGRKPRLADLRESGDIEAHADRVLLLHRDNDLPKGDPVWPIEVVVAKNRNGPVGDVTLSYCRAVMRFADHAPERR